MATNRYVPERDNILMSDENTMRSAAHVNFHLRSKRYTTSQLEQMVDIPLPNFALDLAVPRPPDRQFMGLSYHSPLNEDRSASVQEKLIALLEILEPYADKLHSVVEGDPEVKAPNFYVLQLGEEEPHFVAEVSSSTLNRLALFGFGLYVEVVPIPANRRWYYRLPFSHQLRRIRFR